MKVQHERDGRLARVPRRRVHDHRAVAPGRPDGERDGVGAARSTGARLRARARGAGARRAGDKAGGERTDRGTVAPDVRDRPTADPTRRSPPWRSDSFSPVDTVARHLARIGGGAASAGGVAGVQLKVASDRATRASRCVFLRPPMRIRRGQLAACCLRNAPWRDPTTVTRSSGPPARARRDDADPQYLRVELCGRLRAAAGGATAGASVARAGALHDVAAHIAEDDLGSTPGRRTGTRLGWRGLKRCRWRTVLGRQHVECSLVGRHRLLDPGQGRLQALGHGEDPQVGALLASSGSRRRAAGRCSRRGSSRSGARGRR